MSYSFFFVIFYPIPKIFQSKNKRKCTKTTAIYKKSEQDKTCSDDEKPYRFGCAQNRKKLVATVCRPECVYKRVGKPSVTFCEKEPQRSKRTCGFFV